MALTIFTPTYNRAYCLPNLYSSLCKQSNTNFIWIIVDDGSTDDTANLVSHWIAEKKIHVEYYFQENKGKSQAHNYGVKLTETELFTCVDSDDYISSDAVETILREWETRSSENIVGLLLGKYSINNNQYITLFPPQLKVSTLIDAYNKYGLKGDTMLVFKTDVICQFEFPAFVGEKFVPESYLYDLIDCVGPLKIVNHPAYYCEYLCDGYTANMMKLLKNNPQGYIAWIIQRLRLHDKTFKRRFVDTIRYVAMMLVYKPTRIFEDAPYKRYVILSFFPGLLAYIKKYHNV